MCINCIVIIPLDDIQRYYYLVHYDDMRLSSDCDYEWWDVSIVSAYGERVERRRFADRSSCWAWICAWDAKAFNAPMLVAHR